ncbi:cell division protein ZapA [Neptunomonas phycophila]|jgi:cell division protein ZapA|uniref:Cell division protein ZapA n=2 Tax=Neptunomonas phycophila TaxID=1572645 RepID=A0AAW7XJU2_9GAMM|nr:MULTISPECIES: cell division protein ZapA [Neptunomonas]MBT3145700.1 cell division protein ZapA [Neptunomonas phycophila]MDN2660193.1 cell division protein ZapA [Neptunomonas sp. CHC150]MDO6453218.1 cell division protein ZapA [Neptunomonas phycophila]MDO6469327.1 cell division protein ZapA [Neptunomonas phycophila]MDO6784339.1 cell division protein ZapA [Neptunomonas phycophila]
MSQGKSQKVSIRILDKEYVVGCPDGAEAELFASAEYLDTKMREIRDTGKLLGLDRIAVMAALNMSHELLQNKAQQSELIESRIQRLGSKIDQSLAKLEKGQPEDHSS